MTARQCDVAGCVAGYAARLHAHIGDRHHVASPLGAWLLLALTGPASTGDDRVTLEEVLGCDVDLAATAAAGLLGRPHPLVASAAAVWTAGGEPLGDEFARWQVALPAQVTRGVLPSQAGLDAWAREHTFGLIDKFPVPRTPDLLLVLATALATKVSWQVPFDLAPAAELGQGSPWARQLQRILRAPDRRPGQQAGHTMFIAVSPDAGDVAVHVASAEDGLLVFSVAADPAVPAATVLAAAHQIGCAQAVGQPVRRRSLADLPLGPGPAWWLRAERAASSADVCTAVLPAWHAWSEHDLTDPDLGFEAAKYALLTGPDRWAARQSAMARYSRFGFEAAGVTAMAVPAAFVQPTGSRRVADLRFAHPYAVVAVTIDGNGPAPETEERHSEWHGMPVFSAWVAEPDDAGDDADPAHDASPSSLL